MLTIQRASAGSGKTYTLAFQYILFLVTAQEPGSEKRRLCTSEEVRQSAAAILAVTFTNAATLEMKQRIISRLAALASPDASFQTEYMRDLYESLYGPGNDPNRLNLLRERCAEALAALLHGYSHFNVSTIDSFFQTILRTFTYEAEVSEGYQVEIDSNNVARVGLDETIANLTSDAPDYEIGQWTRHNIRLYSRAGDNWNLFRKSESKRSLFHDLSELSQRMEREEFKLRRLDFDKYFETKPNLYQVYKRIDAVAWRPTIDAFREVKKRAQETFEYFQQMGYGDKDLAQNVFSQINKFRNIYPEKAKLGPSYGQNYKKFVDKTGESPFSANYKKANKGATDQHLSNLLCNVYSAAHDAEEAAEAPLFKSWNLMRGALSDLAFIRAIRQHSDNYLKDLNLIELGETNTILSRIIGDDEVPFIYERLGTRIRNYLIDEFQDTSSMQWENFRPLIAESDSQGFDNLIIGDAKQSIYRFRNAQPRLISEDVPQQFEHISKGDNPKENTNHRSSENIVAFNNTIFSQLASLLDEFDNTNIFSRLYANVVQPIAKMNGRGLVTIDQCEPCLMPDGSDSLTSYTGLGRLINDLHRVHGYPMSKIGILTRTHLGTKRAITALLDFNHKVGIAKQKGDEKSYEDGSIQKEDIPVAFISEESLYLSSSSAVNRVIGILDLIARGTFEGVRKRDTDISQEQEETIEYLLTDAEAFGCSFNYYCLAHPEMTRGEQLRSFNPADLDVHDINRLISNLSSVALPSLIEAIISHLPQELREADAPYLSTLQDKVMEYCDVASADPASFLLWWQNTGKKNTISTPKAEAVTLSTIHKAKGLEYEVVIIPELEVNFKDSSENVWVEPSLHLPQEEPSEEIKELENLLPPLLSVNINEDESANTPYAAKGRAMKLEKHQEKLNLLYVAFTRAKERLHIFASSTKFRENNIEKLLNADLLPGIVAGEILWVGNPKFITNPEKASFTPYTSRKKNSPLEEQPPKFSFRYGEECDYQAPKSSSDTANAPVEIDGYRVNMQNRLLQYEEMERGDEGDSRRERELGTLLHGIMSHVIMANDLERAIRTLRVQGRMKTEDIDTVHEFLRAALAKPEVSRWFDGSMQVLNERAIFFTTPEGTYEQPRPDRVMLTPDGEAIVVDYKFGQKRNDTRYALQIRRYMRQLLASGICTKVSGYLWYVALDDIIEINP